MSRTRIVKGTYTKITGGDHSMYAKGNIVTTAGKSINEIGKEKGITYNMPKSPPKKQSATRVKEIELITPLDLGSKNDGKGKTQEGFIFGKTYKFKVKSFTNGNPVSNKLIRWMYKYHNLTTNKWVEEHSKIKGDQYSLYFNEKEMCGRFVYIRAYIDDEDNEGELKRWHHNRFRWFDRSIIEDEIKERTDNKKPWLVNQSGTSLCGMACIFYLFAKEQPNEYKKFAKTLFRTGEATFNKYIVKPSEELFEINYRNSSYPSSSGKKMPLVDYITMAGTRNTGNPRYKGGSEQFQAINTPWFMDDLCTYLLGYNDVSSINSYNIAKKGKSLYDHLSKSAYYEKIQDLIDSLNEKLSKGYRLILNIDSDLIANDEDYHIPNNPFKKSEWEKTRKSTFEPEYHWVVLESPIQSMIPNLDKDGKSFYTINFKVFSWGDPVGTYLKNPITYDHFYHNYYGDVNAK